MSTIRVGNIGPLTGNTSVIADPGVSGGGMSLVNMTAISLSGTYVDFTGIPSWARRVSVLFNAASLSASVNYRIQLGSGSVTTSGYNTSAAYNGSSVGGTTSTSGFEIYGVGGPYYMSGIITFATLGSNVWVGSGVVGHSSQAWTFTTAGNITLSGALDRVRLTTSTGTDTYDSGTANILYE